MSESVLLVRPGPRRSEWKLDWDRAVSIVWWKGRIHQNSFRSYSSHLYAFLKSVHMNPDEALAWAKSANDKYEVLDKVQVYVNSLQGLRYKSKSNAYLAIRSFFEHNRVELMRDRGFRIHADTPPVERNITIENLREIVGYATQPWRSMILVKWMALLDTEGLNYVNLHHAGRVVEALRKGSDTCRVDIPGRKHTRNIRHFYSFFGTDALDSLREYFDRERGWPKDTEPIWVYGNSRRTDLYGKPVSKNAFTFAWLHLLRSRAKLIPSRKGKGRNTRYGYNVHNTRDLAISLLSTIPNIKEDAIQFWAGHIVDPLGYNEFYSVKPQWVIEQYRTAMPYLNIISKQRISDSDKDQEVYAMKMKLEALEKTIQSMQTMRSGT